VIETVTANRALHTRDLGGTAMTADVTNAVRDLIAKAGRNNKAAGSKPLD
jgi:tartrate dehydrogenase/decarboxylase / D-malate dehydrogenase